HRGEEVLVDAIGVDDECSGGGFARPVDVAGGRVDPYHGGAGGPGVQHSGLLQQLIANGFWVIGHFPRHVELEDVLFIIAEVFFADELQLPGNDDRPDDEDDREDELND